MQSPVAGASQAIGIVQLPPIPSSNVPPVTSAKEIVCDARTPGVVSRMFMWPTTSPGWKAASVVALMLTFELSLPAPPLKYMSS